jgi:hypothetical protein
MKLFLNILLHEHEKKKQIILYLKMTFVIMEELFLYRIKSKQLI